jgi:hypothetical protein
MKTHLQPAAAGPESNPSQNKGEIHFLFRFRDLVADTLEEHRQIIRAHHSCWWGWWKRPTEDARLKVWGRLEQQIASGSPARIGLFDSGSGLVFTALVSEVVPPIDARTPPVVSVPEGETHLIPEYYRRSPYSRAWMRLTRISERPIEFFGHYSLDEAPPLPFYNEEILSRFRGKVIQSSNELRGMDTTIWEVRERKPGDREEQIVLSTGAISSALSRETIDLQCDTILHFTDPHYAVGDFRHEHIWRLEGEAHGEGQSLAEAIEDALNKKQVGLVVITGDFTFTGAAEEFKEAARSIRKLFGILDIDQNRLVIIPGNHDITWTKKKNERYKEDAKVTEAPEAAKANYAAFYRELYGHEPDQTLAMCRRFMLPCGLALDICGLNSSSLETGKKFLAGMGRIQEHAFKKAANVLDWENPGSLALRVLATHHHLTLTENLEPAADYYRGFGIAVDAPRIMRMAAGYGTHLVLHGHKHRAFVWRSGVYELPEHTRERWRLGDVAILGGGSAGSVATEQNKNYFNLIDLSSEGIEVSMYRAENKGSFGVMQRWRAGFELDGAPPRLILRDWEPVPPKG